MPATTINGTYTSNLSAQTGSSKTKINPAHQFGALKHTIDFASVPNLTENQSIINLGEIPVDAVISPLSRLIVSPHLGASTTISLGSANNYTSLVNAANSAANVDVNLINGTQTDRMGKKAWELLGYNSKPALATLTIAAKLGGANAAQAGNIALELVYADGTV